MTVFISNPILSHKWNTSDVYNHWFSYDLLGLPRYIRIFALFVNMTSWYIFVIRHVYIRIQVNTFSQGNYMGWKAVSAYIMDLDMLRIRVIDEEMMLEILYISLRFVNHNLTAFQFCNGYWTGTCTLRGKACYITIGMWMYSWIKICIRYIIFVFIFIFAGYCIRGSPRLACCPPPFRRKKRGLCNGLRPSSP